MLASPPAQSTVSPCSDCMKSACSWCSGPCCCPPLTPCSSRGSFRGFWRCSWREFPFWMISSISALLFCQLSEEGPHLSFWFLLWDDCFVGGSPGLALLIVQYWWRPRIPSHLIILFINLSLEAKGNLVQHQVGFEGEGEKTQKEGKTGELIRQQFSCLSMSIYSGFATRTQENYYDQVLYNVISTLLVRISKMYRDEAVDENSFMKIIANQEKVLRKLEKRKYLEPKYAELLENFMASLSGEALELKKRDMNRTLSVLDREFHNIRELNENALHMERDDSHSLTKIEEKVKKSKRKSKSKRHSSIKTNLDVWQFKAERKAPELPSLHPVEQALMTRSKFNTKMNFSEAHSKEVSDMEDNSVYDRSEQKALGKAPKFRAKMFFRET